MSGFSSSDLQVAVFQALSNDAALTAMVNQVWDQPPATAVFPYVAMGDGKVADASTKDVDLSRHTFKIDVWSDALGRMEAKQIMDLVYQVLHRQSLTLASGVCVSMQFSDAEVKRDDESGSTLYHGMMNFRALVQH